MSPYDIQAGREAVLNILDQSDVRLTPQAYIKEIRERFLIPMGAAKKMLQGLIDSQELSYHYLYGATYVEKSFLRPVRISPHFILKPPGFQSSLQPADIEIILEQGIAFGSGQHPTTQLCLEAIDFCFFEKQMVNCQKKSTGADIGTGSGVLSIAMVLSGLLSCKAYEIDPVSIREAKKNIALNHLTEKINLVEDYMEEHENEFSVIAANLRFPTLAMLPDMLFGSLAQDGIAILSGVREWEKKRLVALYSEKGFELVWQQDDKKWSAFVLTKKMW